MCKGLKIRTDVMALNWERVLAAMTLPLTWCQQFCAWVHAEDTVREFMRQKAVWEETKRRTLELYRKGALEPDEYERYIAEAEAALTALGQPDRLEPVNEQPYLGNLLKVWQVATPKERRSWLVQCLRQTYWDLRTEHLVWVEPNAAFQTLFQEAGLPRTGHDYFDVSALTADVRRPDRRRKVTPERVAEVRRVRNEDPGLSLRELGKRVGLSHEEVRQILKQTD